MTWTEDIQAAVDATFTAQAGSRPQEGAALGYGVDLSCVSSVTDDLLETDPNSPRGMAEMAMRSCLTPRDSAPDAPGRGFDVRRALNEGVTPVELRAYEGMAQSEIEQDDRVGSAEVNLTVEGSIAIPLLRLRFRLFPNVPGVNPFTAVFVVPATGAAMLELLQ